MTNQAWMAEVDAKMAAIESDPKQFEPYDLNKDGRLDEQERERLRAILIAEVRTKHELRGDGSATTGDMPTLLASRYQVQRLLGEGGQGKTYLAHDTQADRQVVVKRLHLAHLDNWKAIELFEREGKTLSQLEHPSIPTYHDAFHEQMDNGECFYLVQEYIEGQTIYEAMNSGKSYTQADVESMMVSILNILTYLHQHSPPIIHRDIKPSNIIQRPDGQWALIDFGAIQSLLSTASMVGSTIVGTSGYMAPEQFMGRSIPATDLYALGATAVHMLSREHPSLLPMHHMKLQFANRIAVEPYFEQVLDRLLEPMAEQRYKTAQEVIEALRTKNHAVVPAPTDAMVASTQPQKPKGVVAGVAVTALAALGGVGYVALVPAKMDSPSVDHIVTQQVKMPKAPSIAKPTLKTVDLDDVSASYTLPRLADGINPEKLSYENERYYKGYRHLSKVRFGMLGDAPFTIKRVVPQYRSLGEYSFGMVAEHQSTKHTDEWTVSILAVDAQGNVLYQSDTPNSLYQSYKPVLSKGDIVDMSWQMPIPDKTAYVLLKTTEHKLDKVAKKSTRATPLPLKWEVKQPKDVALTIHPYIEELDESFSTSHKMAVYIENTGKKTISQLKLEKRYMDADGHLVAKTESYAVGGYDPPLEPGEKRLCGLTTRMHKKGASYRLSVVTIDTIDALPLAPKK